jgi:type VI secretion system secreted protein Hcp
MAIDVYLQIEGIRDESKDDKPKDWIEVSGIHCSIHQPRSARAKDWWGSGGSTRGGWDLAANKIA